MPPATTRSKDEEAPVRLSRPARVAEEIKDWIVQEHFSAGDRLPSEPELIERFSMAKGTIREAMRILEAQGLVKSRTGPGGGTFVHEVSKERARALLGNYFYFKDLTIRDIYGLRRVLEPELAASLAGRLPDEVLGQLEAIVAEYREPARTVEEERAQHVASTHCFQVHGGIAFTVEHGFFQWVRRGLLLDQLLGGHERLTAELGRRLIERSGVPRVPQL